MTNLRTPLLQGLNLLGSDYHEKNQRRNRRCERRGDHDGFVLIIFVVHNKRMYTIYRRVGWFGNYLGKEDLHGYNCSISNNILCFLTSHISSIFRYNHIWLVTTCLTLPLNLNLL